MQAQRYAHRVLLSKMTLPTRKPEEPEIVTVASLTTSMGRDVPVIDADGWSFSMTHLVGAAPAKGDDLDHDFSQSMAPDF